MGRERDFKKEDKEERKMCCRLPSSRACLYNLPKSKCLSAPLWWTVPWHSTSCKLPFPAWKVSFGDKWFCLLICLFKHSQICYKRVVNISVIIFINRYINVYIFVIDRIVFCMYFEYCQCLAILVCSLFSS